jgi:sensor histidine kinase regulating citrate/malate metabolism
MLPLACSLVEVFAIDTSPAALVRPGALVTTLFVQIVLLILYYTIIAFEYRLMQSALDNEKSLNRQHLLNLQLQQNSIMKDRIEQARRARHDLRHFRNVVAVYAREGDVEGLREYLGQLDAIADDDPLVWCENTVVNAILGHYVAKARKLGADVQVHATVPQDCPLTEVQSSVVVGNVLENAVSALEHAKDVGGVRLAISINVAVRDNNQFTLDVRNTYAGEILRNGQGRLLSTKHEGTGVGTASVTALAEQAGGFARFGSEGGLFRSFVLLPLS